MSEHIHDWHKTGEITQPLNLSTSGIVRVARWVKPETMKGISVDVVSETFEWCQVCNPNHSRQNETQARSLMLDNPTTSKVK